MTKLGWLREDTDKERSLKQEKRLAKRVGGKTTPRSGAGRIKNDVLSPVFSFEAKTTKHAGYSFTLAEWTKVERNAGQQGLTPAMSIRLQHDREFVILTMEDFLHLKSVAERQTDTP